jgi:hypothetical protein
LQVPDILFFHFTTTVATNTPTTPLTPEQRIAQLEAELKAKDAIIEGQAEELKASEAQGAAALPVITHDKKQYRVLAAKFQHKGQEVKAEDLKGNKELVAELIKAKSGLLQLVVAETAKEAEEAK